MPDQDEQPKPEAPKDEEFERAIEGAEPANPNNLNNHEVLNFANGTTAITTNATGNLVSLNIDGLAVGNLGQPQMMETLVQYGIVRNKEDRIEMFFEKKVERHPVLGFNTYSTTSGNSCTNGRMPEDQIPDISDKIKGMVFMVMNDNLVVRIETVDQMPICFMTRDDWHPPLFTFVDQDMPVGMDSNICSTVENAREVMLRHLFMFGARGMDREKVEDDLVSLYVRNAKHKIPDWLPNVSFKEKMLYMTSPFIREIGSEAVLLNCFSRYGEDENWMRKDFGYTYKELCKKIVGTDSPSILKGVWDILLSGNEFRAYQYQDSVDFLSADAKRYVEEFAMGKDGRKKYESERGSVWVGDRKIVWGVLTLVGAIYEAFGVDHARNFCVAMKKDIELGLEAKKNGQAAACVYSMTTNAVYDKPSTVAILKEMSKFCSHQKILKGVLQSDLRWMKDGAKMYRDYADPQKIPAKLRNVYPNGIEVPKSWGTFKEWHDKISKAYHLIAEEEKNAPFEDYPEYFYLLDGVKSKDWEIEIAREAKHLVVWGRDLKLCVGSYGDRVKRKEAFMICIKVQDKPKYVMHLDWRTLVEYIEKGALQQRVKHVFAWCAGADDREIPPLGDENGVMRPIDAAVEANVEFKVDGNKVPPQEEYDIAHNMVAEWIGVARELMKEKLDAEARNVNQGEALPDVVTSVSEVVEPGRRDNDGHRPHTDDDGGRPDRVQGDGGLQGPGAEGGDSPVRLGHELVVAEGPRPEDGPRAAGAAAG